MEPAIRIENATKEYISDGSRFMALRGIDLTIEKGQFVTIMGPSGSGKSTLLHLLGCLDLPTSGEVYLDGIKVSGMSQDELATVRNQKIGFVFQAFNLSPTMSVFRNVELPLIIKEVDPQVREKIVNECLSLVGLTPKAKNKSSQLSGGEKQRVAIARALANNPQIILADEPTGNLDSTSGKNVMDFLQQLWRTKGITVIVVTHEPVVAAYSEKIIHIKDGRVEKETKQKARHHAEIGDIKIKEVS